ncbi:MAG TPA: hypothetical protein VGK93_04650 [Candidatus Eisenbacteria bacterium]|jgi:hypothetical protein
MRTRGCGLLLSTTMTLVTVRTMAQHDTRTPCLKARPGELPDPHGKN